MKLTLLTTLAGPRGIAFPGGVIDVSKKEDAEDMIKRRFARPFDADRDSKAKVGLQKAGK